MTDDLEKEPSNKEKVYVLDTSILIEDPEVIYKIGGGGNIVIPKVVIRELDGLKNSEKENTARAARQVARTLDLIGSNSDLVEGAKLSTGSILSIYSGYEVIDDLNSASDNKIVGAAIQLKKIGKEVTLYSTDANMRSIVRLYGVKAEYSPFFKNNEADTLVRKAPAPRPEFRDLADEALYDEMIMMGMYYEADHFYDKADTKDNRNPVNDTDDDYRCHDREDDLRYNMDYHIDYPCNTSTDDRYFPR